MIALAERRADLLISIHAPAKGATVSVLYFCTSAHGFQSTLPRRERPNRAGRQLLASQHFNPRSREGSDHHVDEHPLVVLHISIHAPAKGATAKITKTIPNDFGKINNYNNSFA